MASCHPKRVERDSTGVKDDKADHQSEIALHSRQSPVLNRCLDQKQEIWNPNVTTCRSPLTANTPTIALLTYRVRRSRPFLFCLTAGGPSFLYSNSLIAHGRHSSSRRLDEKTDSGKG